MRAETLALGMGLSLILGTVWAEEPLPTMEFLEFIGEWEGEDGAWIDPESLASVTIAVEGDENEVQNDE